MRSSAALVIGRASSPHAAALSTRTITVQARTRMPDFIGLPGRMHFPKGDYPALLGGSLAPALMKWKYP